MSWVCALTCASGAMLGWGCGSDAPTEGVPSGNEIVFTREDASVIAFAPGATQYVWCGQWESGVVATQTLHVWVGGPAASNPYFYLRAVIADVSLGQPLTFPNSFIWDQPDSADVFLFDAPTNELSSAEMEASGNVTFQALGCANGASVHFTAGAVLGSEISGPTVTMSGTFEATVGQSPPWQ